MLPFTPSSARPRSPRLQSPPRFQALIPKAQGTGGEQKGDGTVGNRLGIHTPIPPPSGGQHGQIGEVPTARRAGRPPTLGLGLNNPPLRHSPASLRLPIHLQNREQAPPLRFGPSSCLTPQLFVPRAGTNTRTLVRSTLVLIAIFHLTGQPTLCTLSDTGLPPTSLLTPWWRVLSMALVVIVTPARRQLLRRGTKENSCER